jgi:hypothetical protein
MRANCSAIIGGKYSRLVRQSVAVLLLRERAQQQISCTPPAALFGSAAPAGTAGRAAAAGAAAAQNHNNNKTNTPQHTDSTGSSSSTHRHAPPPNAQCPLPGSGSKREGVPLGCVCCVGSPGVRVLCVGRCACGFKWVCKLQMHNAPTHTSHPHLTSAPPNRGA